MPDPVSKSLPALGFLASIEHPTHGAMGGYLILNGAGRPLEFHCTAPVKANRAQEILYGPTLGPYLYGEQIGQTLVNKAKIRPHSLLTDTPAMLAVRDFVDLPIAFVETADECADGREDDDFATPLLRSTFAGPTSRFELGERHLHVLREHADDQARLIAQIAPLTDAIELAEPFERIRDAVTEANRAA
ncbi:MAG: hypothetical protein KDA42_17085 [Planctomycetales bacterium]|nr:hypothetical protein [Planctomycetales bacterium]